MTDIAQPQARTRFADLVPGLLSALSFGLTDVLIKPALWDGAAPGTALTIRGVFGVALIALWLKFSPPAKALTQKQLLVALGLGILFAGNVYMLFMSVALTTVPFGILTYFIYPLMTGLAAAATGIDRISMRGAVLAAVAFSGLALMIGANPGGILWLGAALSLGAALTRTVTLIVTRFMLQGAELKWVTCYYMISSTVVFALASLATLTWVPPHTIGSWAAVFGYGATMVAGVATLFASTARIGPFRTAMLMNLEPPLATLISAIALGESITPVQMLGGAVMLGAITLFQMRR